MLDELATLILGSSRLADGPLRSEEDDALRRAIGPGEPVRAWVRGRAERLGWMLWAVTETRFVVVHVRGKRAPGVHPLAAVRQLQEVQGRWGATLRVDLGTTREAIFAADPALSDAFVAALGAGCPALAMPAPLAAPPPRPAPPAEAPAPVPAADVEASLRELAALRAQGLLSEAAYTALEERMGGPSR